VRDARRFATILLAAPLAALASVGCVSGGRLAPASVERDARPVAFSLVTVAGEPVDAASLRGRPTVVLVFTSYDVTSQLVAARIEELRHTFRPRINALGVALEPPKNAMLVEAFAASMGLGFPVAMADHALLQGRGPFGSVQVIPVVLVLDRRGRPVWRGVGPVETEAIKRALAKATSGRDAPAVQEVSEK
jgi:hypothetical protein